MHRSQHCKFNIFQIHIWNGIESTADFIIITTKKTVSESRYSLHTYIRP
jgi:hypothetical protein